MTTIRSDITQGPSKFELMLALFDRKSVNTRDIAFKLSTHISAHVVINGVEVEDGSGECWIFKGYVRGVTPTTTQGVPAVPRTCIGWYRTDTRKGWIELVD